MDRGRTRNKGFDLQTLKFFRIVLVLFLNNQGEVLVIEGKKVER